MKLSDYVADFIAKLTPRVYTVCGAGAMHLNDSISHHPGIISIAMHHEQAAAFAAEADARVTNGIGVVCVTAGPGGTNALTGVACAYVDSIPMLVIAGQVTSGTMAWGRLRQSGMNELPMATIANQVTKHAVTVDHPQRIAYELEKAVAIAMSGRRGPVFVEIPLDIQAADIDPSFLHRFIPIAPQDDIEEYDIKNCVASLERASRPVMIIGNGVRLSGAEEALRAFLDRFHMPVVTSWGARDIIPDHDCVIGSCGIFGDRQSNWAVQNADLILAVGTRLSYPQTGHHRDLFAPNAKKIVVDIDWLEAKKLDPDLPIAADCEAFFEAVVGEKRERIVWESWLNGCRAHGDRGEHVHFALDGICAYTFVRQLSEHLADDAIVVTDVGFSFIPTMQTLKLKRGQRLFHSGGVSPMGWAIPAAVGAAFAAPGRQIVCLTGDGGAMMNLQELQTITHHKLPISIFVYANNGYETIKLMQRNHFGREAVAGPESGVSCPDFANLAQEFELANARWDDILAVTQEDDCVMRDTLSDGRPCVVQLHLAPSQVIAPRVQSRMENGKFVPTPIDHMWPPLEAAEAAE